MSKKKRAAATSAAQTDAPASEETPEVSIEQTIEQTVNRAVAKTVAVTKSQISWRWILVGLLAGLLFSTLSSCSCCGAEPQESNEPQYARNLEDVHAASCRVFAMDTNGRGAIGTGTVCGLIRGKYYVLTNWHVVEGHRNVTLHFFRDGNRFEVKGEVVASWHNDNQPFDFAIITVHERDLADYQPPIVPLAPRGSRPTVGKTILSSGCSEGRWSMAWKGAIESYHGGYGNAEGNVAIFYPAPKGGQSGSAIVEELHGNLFITGVLTWRIGDEKSTSEEKMRGGCIAVAKLYDAFDGKMKSGILDAVPEDATWCLKETDGDPDETPSEDKPEDKPVEEPDSESETDAEAPIVAEQEPPIHNPGFDHSDTVSFSDRCYAIEDTESFKAPVAESQPVIEMIEFYSENCIPCQTAKPIVAQFVENGYVIHSLCVDEEKWKQEAMARQVTAVPTFITYRSFDNRVTWEEIGRFSGIDYLEERIRQAFSSGNSGGVSHDGDQTTMAESPDVNLTRSEVAPLIEEYENGFFGRRGGNSDEDPAPNTDPAPFLRRNPDRTDPIPDRGGIGSSSSDEAFFQRYRDHFSEIFSWIKDEVKVMIWSALRWAVLIVTVFWFLEYWLICALKAVIRRLPKITFEPSEKEDGANSDGESVSSRRSGKTTS